MDKSLIKRENQIGLGNRVPEFEKTGETVSEIYSIVYGNNLCSLCNAWRIALHGTLTK